jgi:nitrogen regulatory protein PII
VILDTQGVGGISITTIRGKGREAHEPVPEMVRSYMTGRKIIPEFATRLKIEAIVPDAKVKAIVDDHDISEAYDVTKQASGESALD